MRLVKSDCSKKLGREQKEGKGKRLAEDAGESGSKALPLENRPPGLRVEQNVPSVLQSAVASRGKVASRENSMSSAFDFSVSADSQPC